MTSFTPALRMAEGGDPMPRLEPPEGYKRMKLWAGEEFAFEDLLDFINPLQHIPIVSDIYRAVTGDKVGALAQLTVGGLVGGPFGLIGSAVAVALETETGKSTAEIAASLFDAAPSGGTANVAQADRFHRQGLSDRASEVAWESGAPGAPAFAVAQKSAPAEPPRLDRALRDAVKPDGPTLEGAKHDAAKLDAAKAHVEAAVPAAPSGASVERVSTRPVSTLGKKTPLHDAAIPPAARQALAGRAAAPVTMGRVDPTAALLAAQAKGANPLAASMMQALDKYEALKVAPAMPRAVDVVN